MRPWYDNRPVVEDTLGRALRPGRPAKTLFYNGAGTDLMQRAPDGPQLIEEISPEKQAPPPTQSPVTLAEYARRGASRAAAAAAVRRCWSRFRVRLRRVQAHLRPQLLWAARLLPLLLPR